MALALLALIVLLVLAINAWAIYIGDGKYTFLHNSASALGGMGLLSFLGLLIAYVDFFTQIWVMREGYEGEFVLFFLCATGGSTLLSLLVCTAITIKDRWHGA
ncbi:hypothetical protein ASD77_06710 [Pseudoxanthomonas sp. Root65]|uniref:hypothetical protein n=1 Tax=Pseudoxanthomonas sp. Root65 TaxID=1736576 RepID=UPI0006F23233|nr:hypothetical protein [Pseudoxanthomonas sp. Root65]KRA54304.1 hypothetical protein ASD77_06710 [Pseudoxanthomonas sp. Root65]